MDKRTTQTIRIYRVDISNTPKDKLELCNKCCFGADGGYICCAPRSLYDEQCGITHYYDDID